MKLSKLGLWFLGAYLLWAGVSYSSYRECLTYPQGGLWINMLGCDSSLWIATIPMQSILEAIAYASGLSGTSTDQQMIRSWVPFSFVLCCILYYTLGAGIGWLRRRKRP